MQPVGYGMGGAPMQAAGGSYEFSAMENDTIRSTARYARLWGIISIVAGILMAIVAVLLVVAAVAVAAALGPRAGFVGAAGGTVGPLAVVYLVCGFFYLGSGRALHAVVDTQGNDIQLLMTAMKSLSRAFMIESIASIVAFFAGIGLGVLAHTTGRM